MKMWVIGAASLLAAGPATGFYFPSWPADGLPRPVSLAGPAVPGYWEADAGPAEQPAAGPARWVPEPATAVLAVIGLAAVVRRRPGPPAAGTATPPRPPAAAARR